MIAFSLTAPHQTLFGRGTRSAAADEIARRGARVVLVRGRSVPWVDDLARDLVARDLSVLPIPLGTEPTVESVRTAVAAARDHRADVVVSVGGGAVVDLGKAVSGLCHSAGDVTGYLELGGGTPGTLNTPLPFVAIPTTAGTGAEATRNAVIGVPDRQAKISLRDPRLVPDLALVDPALTDGTPKALTLASGLDAVTQLIESYLCNRANPLTDALCRATIPAAVQALVRLMQREDPAARDAMARASYLSGIALANSGLGIVHGLASVIGGLGAPHGAVCGRLLAPALEVNAQAAADAGGPVRRFEEVRHCLARGLDAHAGQTIAALRRFVDAHGLPTLDAMGVRAAMIDSLAAQAMSASSTKANPVVLDKDQIRRIMTTA